jgi:hypothetical protein
VKGASHPGTLIYNSWLTMQADGESDPDACAYNDLALIRIDPADVGSVNPSVPGFGGPTGVGTVGGLGSTVHSYGKRRESLATRAVALNATGGAIGVLSTLQLAPLASTNGVGDLGKELAYMRAHSGFGAMQLVPGTEPFKANLVGAILGS